MNQDHVGDETFVAPAIEGGTKAATKAAVVPAVPMWNTRYGVVLADSSDSTLTSSLKNYGEWLEQELDIIGALLQEGQVVLEYGAELGAHALWLSRMVGSNGSVYAVEPLRLNHIALCATLALNQLSNVYPLHAAMGGEQGQLEFGATDGGTGEASRMVSLDSLKLEKLHLLKVNQPASLLALLAGAEKTLREHQPIVYFRLTSLAQSKDEIAALKARGYRCWSHLPYLYNAENFSGNADNLFPGWVGQNVIAVHRDKSAGLAHLVEL